MVPSGQSQFCGSLRTIKIMWFPSGNHNSVVPSGQSQNYVVLSGQSQFCGSLRTISKLCGSLRAITIMWFPPANQNSVVPYGQSSERCSLTATCLQQPSRQVPSSKTFEVKSRIAAQQHNLSIPISIPPPPTPSQSSPQRNTSE